jgi:hypothetical protein
MSPSRQAKLPSPWDRFLEELDGLLREQVHVHCIGGFVVSLFYGLPRPTADVDYFAVIPIGSVERNSQKDRDDAAFLAESLHLKPEVLRERYKKELRPYLTNEGRHDLTIELWLDVCFEEPPLNP